MLRCVRPRYAFGVICSTVVLELVWTSAVSISQSHPVTFGCCWCALSFLPTLGVSRFGARRARKTGALLTFQPLAAEQCLQLAVVLREQSLQFLIVLLLQARQCATVVDRATFMAVCMPLLLLQIRLEVRLKIRLHCHNVSCHRITSLRRGYLLCCCCCLKTGGAMHVRLQHL